MECDVTDVAVFASATETFAQRNLGCSVSESLAMFAPVVEQARASNLGVRGYVSMCFRDPWEGAVDPRKVVDVVLALVGQGCQQISLGDTIGAATGDQVMTLLGMLADAGVGPDLLAMHFHDTYGQALANTLLSLEFGVTTIDASAGGLGGCPFAKSATGNLATEELVWMLHGLGIETGVDLPALVATSRWLAGELGRPSPSALVRAWPMENHE
jgi:hydroxymethylglutaryl-CoA lyase